MAPKHLVMLLLLIGILLELGAGLSDLDDEDEGGDEAVEAEDGEDDDESDFWSDPSIYMKRLFAYITEMQDVRAQPLLPPRSDVDEATYRVMKVKRGFMLPQDVSQSKVQIDAGEVGEGAYSPIISLSGTVVPMVSGGERYNCHIPDPEAPVELSPTPISDEEALQKAHDGMAMSLGQRCYEAHFNSWGMEYCWGHTVKHFDLHGEMRGEERVLGRNPNTTHEYSFVSDGLHLDPLALHTVYTDGDPCNYTDPLTKENTTKPWVSDVYFHCTDTTDKERQDLGGRDPSRGPGWSYISDSCRWRIDIWNRHVCTATYKRKQSNTKYILCVPQPPRRRGTATAAS